MRLGRSGEGHRRQSTGVLVSRTEASRRCAAGGRSEAARPALAANSTPRATRPSQSPPGARDVEGGGALTPRSAGCAHVAWRAARKQIETGFTLVHYSVQENHVHLIVEAESHGALLSGVRGLMVRIARRVNRLLCRRGRFWADRWHGRDLEGRGKFAMRWFMCFRNHKKHAGSAALDPLSSAGSFDGFASTLPKTFRSIGPPCVARAKTWLLKTGWRRRGLIELSEAPARR